MTTNLTNKKCTPCRGGIPPLTKHDAQNYLSLVPGWEMQEDGVRIHRTYKLGNFKEALDFVQLVGDLAEEEGHHPDLSFGWGYATISLQTKKIKGLHENDFIIAAKINEIAEAIAADPA